MKHQRHDYKYDSHVFYSKLKGKKLQKYIYIFKRCEERHNKIIYPAFSCLRLKLNKVVALHMNYREIIEFKIIKTCIFNLGPASKSIFFPVPVYSSSF